MFTKLLCQDHRKQKNVNACTLDIPKIWCGSKRRMTGQEDKNCRALKVIYRYQLGPADRRGRVDKLTASVDFSLHSQLQPLVGGVKPI